MLELLITALLPVLLTFLSGAWAARKKEFTAGDARTLTRLVMHYALPMALFAHISAMPRASLLGRLPLATLLAVGILVPFIGVYFLYCQFFRWQHRHEDPSHALEESRSQAAKRAMIFALCLSTPSIPFVGTAVLGELFGAASGLVVSLGGVIINLVQLPVAMLVLSDAPSDHKASMPAGRKPFRKLLKSLGRHALTALHEPVVWAPLLGISLVLIGISIPAMMRHSLHLLAQTTGGIALFATGIVLQTHRVVFSLPVALAVATRNLVVPLALLAVVLLGRLPLPQEIITQSITALSLPTAALGTILAVNFKTAEREAASILFFSTLLTIASLNLTKPVGLKPSALKPWASTLGLFGTLQRTCEQKKGETCRPLPNCSFLPTVPFTFSWPGAVTHSASAPNMP